MSEVYGRQIVFAVTYGICTCFALGCTLSRNVGTLLAMRLLGGIFGSTPTVNAGSIIADIFPAADRGLATSLFALAPSLGPCLGPICSGFLAENAGWRWVMGLVTILAGICWVLGVVLVPETYAPVLLRRRAKVLSKRTGKVYMTKADIQSGPIKFAKVLKTALTRPLILLTREPIVLILTIYISILYGKPSTSLHESFLSNSH